MRFGVETMDQRSTGTELASKLAVATAAISAGFASHAEAAYISTKSGPDLVLTVGTPASYDLNIDAQGPLDYTISADADSIDVTGTSTSNQVSTLFNFAFAFDSTAKLYFASQTAQFRPDYRIQLGGRSVRHMVHIRAA